MQLDVFTLVPSAFAWLTERPPVSGVLGNGLDLRLFNYRDFTPLTGGQVDDEPYGGGAGMVLRVDVAAAALDAVYGEAPAHRVVALTPQGRQLDQAVVEELAARSGSPCSRRASRDSTSASCGIFRQTRSRSGRTYSPAVSCRRW